MNTEQEVLSLKRFNIDWRWVGVGYCMLLAFHFLPTWGILDAVRNGFESRWLIPVWFFVGIGLISCYIGYRSTGVTLIEPAYSSIFYALTLMVKFGVLSPQVFSWRTAGYVYTWTAAILVISIGAAWIGELLQARREKKVHQV